MKRFFSLALLFFCATLPAADEEILPGENTSPKPEEKMIGDWQGFLLEKEMPVTVTGTCYRFLPSGIWEILEDAPDAKTEQQGWYRINTNENSLLLQPREAAEKKDDAAIRAGMRGETAFIIPNPVEENLALLFLKKDTVEVPTAASLAGRWSITQMDLESGEKRVAPYCLLLKKDGSYALEQPETELPEEWAKGSFTISGIKLDLKNEFKGSGLWDKPCFFFYEGKLFYNNSLYCVWCEKMNQKTDSKGDSNSKADSNAQTDQKPASH